MKKIILSVFILTLMIGVTGCNKQSQIKQGVISSKKQQEEENKKTENENFYYKAISFNDNFVWKKYQNEKFGFEMMYPGDWEIYEDTWRKNSKHKVLSRGGGDNAWVVAFNTGLKINDEIWPIYLGIKEISEIGKIRSDVNYIYNDGDIIIYEENNYSSYIVGEYNYLYLFKYIEDEGLGVKPVLDKEIRIKTEKYLNDIIKTIKFIEK